MLFALIIFAVLLRIVADTYHFVLYALCQIIIGNALFGKRRPRPQNNGPKCH